jgi:hypothetical protein
LAPTSSENSPISSTSRIFAARTIMSRPLVIRPSDYAALARRGQLR